MNSKRFAVLISLATAAFAQAGGNMLQNGGFEDGPPIGVTPLQTGTGYWTYGAGQSLDGWVVGEDSVDLVSSPYAVQSGSYAVDLNGSPGPGSITQTFSSTSNEVYVSFWLGSNETNQNVAVDFDGKTIETIATSSISRLPTYTEYSFYANATPANNSLEFAIVDSPASYGNTFIDNVSVTTAPSPMAVLPFAFGICPLILRHRKRK